MKSNRFYLLKGKESFIDHVKSVNTLGYCYWSKSGNKNLMIGDICYLYLSGDGHNAIRYKLEVVDINSPRLDEECWIARFRPSDSCYKLKPIGEYFGGNELAKEILEDIGISRYVQFMELTPKQVSYIDRFFC